MPALRDLALLGMALSLCACAPSLAAQDAGRSGGAPGEARSKPATPAQDAPAFETITRKLKDGVTLTADLWRASGAEPAGAPHPVLVAFHATRSSRGEYRTIAPEFVRRGFHVLAVDLRYGGPGELGNRKTKERTGTMNETWKSATALLGREPTAIEAYEDFPAILAWTRELFPNSKLGLVGSSYSASLVLVWAAEHPKTVDAVYAFSPGEWIDGWNVALRAKKLATPCFFTCGSGGPDTEQAKKLLAQLDTRPTVYLPADEGQNGLHGVGTLHMKFDADRTELWKRLDAALTWLRPLPSSTPSAPTPSPK
ncbi:MAG: alpha/beta fold hydrolase [Planctomycetes bacterium]|nr:alpha/beta fold hydrolase [Planctomycetota bacterium]